MTADDRPERPDPTDTDREAVAAVASIPDFGEWSDDAHPDHNAWTYQGERRTEAERNLWREVADAILTTRDPAARAALIRSLIAGGTQDVLDELVRAGVPVTVKRDRHYCGCAWCCRGVPIGQAGEAHRRSCPNQRPVTPSQDTEPDTPEPDDEEPPPATMPMRGYGSGV